MPELMLDAAGRRRSPATLPEFHADKTAATDLLPGTAGSSARALSVGSSTGAPDAEALAPPVASAASRTVRRDRLTMVLG